MDKMTSISPVIFDQPPEDDIQRQICQDFVRAIRKNDATELSKILENSIPESKEILLNGAIQDEVTFTNCQKIVQEISVNRAIPIAILEQSYECFEYLLDSGAGILPTPKDDNNILHYLVYSYALNKNEIVCKMYERILQNSDIVKRRELLLRENERGLTPLELAANLACSNLFLLYLYTEGVHRQVQKSSGKAVTNIFTFTKDDGSKGSSFLWQLANCKSDDASSDVVAMLENSVVKDYIRKKFLRILPVAIVWFIIRLFPLIASFNDEYKVWSAYSKEICQNTSPNRSTFSQWFAQANGNSTDYVHLICYPIYGFSMLIFDVTELIYLCICSKKSIVEVTRLSEDRVVNSGFYRGNTFCLGLFILAIGLAEASGSASVDTEKETVVTIFHLFNLILTIMSVLYFIQLWPVIGYFIIGFQKMLAAVSRFVILQLIVLMVFSALFTYVRVYACATSKKVCDRILNFYDTFLMMLNMVSDIVPSDSTCEDWGIVCLQLLHAAYVFVVAILVINYLIAVMSSAYNNFAFLQNSLQPLHKLHFTLTIERRLGMFRKLVPSKFNMKSRDTEDILVITEVCRDFEIIDSLMLPAERREEKVVENGPIGNPGV